MQRDRAFFGETSLAHVAKTDPVRFAFVIATVGPVGQHRGGVGRDVGQGQADSGKNQSGQGTGDLGPSTTIAHSFQVVKVDVREFVAEQRCPSILIGRKQAQHSQSESNGGLFTLIEGISIDSRRREQHQVGMHFATASLNDPTADGRYTLLMQWTSWQVPLLLGFLLLRSHWRSRVAPAAGLTLSILLLLSGIVLGTMIDGQTTLVTAHYHGTIGAVTLAFMGLTYGILPVLGHEMPPRPRIDLQLRFYGYGILLMMSGLAGAGLMGAPRKTAGNVGMEFGVETISRMVLGLGGTLATIGILMFLVLVLRQIWPRLPARVVRHG